MNRLHIILRDTYISHLKNRYYEKAFKFLDNFYIWSTCNPDNKILIPWIICATIAHGKNATIQYLTYIEHFFGKEYFMSPVFITMSAYLGHLEVLKYLWLNYAILPQKNTLELVMKRGHYAVGEYMMIHQIFSPPMTINMELAQDMFNQFLA
jgi:hypothetical protein